MQWFIFFKGDISLSCIVSKFFLDKIKPKIKDCADDVSKYSDDRILLHSLPKFTDMFEDFNESLSLSSHKGLFVLFLLFNPFKELYDFLNNVSILNFKSNICFHCIMILFSLTLWNVLKKNNFNLYIRQYLHMGWLQFTVYGLWW